MRVSLIIPTGNRHLLLRRAFAQIARQTLAPHEVIVVDGGARPFPWADAHASFRASPVHIRTSYERVGELTTVGFRRNVACDLATGDVICHWDDDDFYAPDYLRTLVHWYESTPVDLGGMCQFYHYDFLLRRGWKTNLWDARNQGYGACFVYKKSLWRDVGGFKDIQRGEDDDFAKRFLAKGLRLDGLQRPDLFVYMRHTKNVSWSTDPIFHPDWTRSARAVMGSDIEFYDDLAELVHQPTEQGAGLQFHLPSNLRTFVPEKGRRPT